MRPLKMKHYMLPQNERLIRLNNIARRQIEILKDNKNIKELEILHKQVEKDKMLE